MYDVPPTGPVLLGWLLAGATLLLAAVRAVRVERRRAPAVGGPRPAGRVDRAVDVATVTVVVALLAVLVGVVLTGLS